MRPGTFHPLIVGLVVGIGAGLGLRRAPRSTKAWPELAGNFAL